MIDLAAYDENFSGPSASADELAAARAAGAFAERERIKAILTGPLAKADLQSAVALALSGASPSAAAAAAKKAGNHGWDEIVATFNRKGSP